MRKLASLILAVVMVLSMTVAAFAEETNYTITVQHKSDTNVSLAGNTYYAYKLFDVTYDTDRKAYAYTVAPEFERFTYSGASGKELIGYVEKLGENSDELNAFAQSVLDYIIDKNTDVDNDNNIAPILPKNHATVPEGENSVDINVGEPGYYLVAGSATADGEQTITAACALSTAAPNTTINVKADAPKLEKKIIENDVPVDANNAAIGDTVHYQINSKVPNMTGYEKYYFVVNDTLSAGLTFDGIMADEIVEYPGLEVKIGNTNKTIGVDYTVEASKNENGTTSIKIIFKNFVQYKDQVGADIVIDYTAVINENAVIGSEGNDNVAKLEYSNNPNVKPGGDPDNPDKPGPDDPKGETPEDRVITYVTGVEIIKVDATNGDRLVGAEFTINGEKVNKIKVIQDVFEESEDGTYYKLKDGTYTETAPTNDTLDHYESETTYKKVSKPVVVEKVENVGVRGTVDNNGVLHFDGLAAGEYTITEVVAPNGYNLLEEPIIITIGCEVPEEVTEENDKASWSYITTDNDGSTVANVGTDENGRIRLTVENNAGTLLPSTGGIGTTIFYAAGIILMAGAVFFIVRRKRA